MTIRLQSRYSHPRTVLFLCGALLLYTAPLQAQLQRQSAAPTAACSSPLGTLLPECQSSKASFEIPLGSRPVAESPLPRPAPSRLERNPVPLKPETPPDPPPAAVSEFQRFVASSVGRVLPVFGIGLFDHAPSTFAPVERVPVTADYVIGPGDELVLRVWGQVNLDLEMTVDPSGAIFIPQVGNLNVTGLLFRNLPAFLRTNLGHVYRNFDFTVSMGQLRSIPILVVGQARRPGTYTVSSLSTLVNALFASGGPSSQGSMRRIQLKRGTRVVTEFDLYDLLLNGDKSRDARLLPGDVVYIPPAGPQVAVAGSINNPAIFELKEEQTAGQLLQLAGGLSAVADGQMATLERIRDRRIRETLDLKLDAAGLAVPVRNGDVVHVYAISPRFENAVTLRGNVANPGRFAWRQGMRIRDVIPDRESLLTREYWSKRNLLGFTPEEDTVAASPDAESKRKPAKTTVAVYAPEINWSYAVIERRNQADLRTELLPFHLGKLVLEGDAAENLELRPGDVITILSQADLRVASAQQNRMVQLEGEFSSSGIYAARAGETLGQLIRRAGGLTPQAYLFGAEFIRESTRADQQKRMDEFTRELEREVEMTSSRQQFRVIDMEEERLQSLNLQNSRRLVERLRNTPATGRIVLSLDPDDNSLAKLMDLTLESGDRFVVPARPATVNVFGSVYNQNSFIHRADLSVGEYLRRAGGITRWADKSRMFIIRADGTVMPRQGPGGLGKNFELALLNPGDSVVVPEALLKTSFMRGLKDWSQIFTQFGLGAAAINILR